MAMSERDRQVLEELEASFLSPTAPAPRLSRLRMRPATRLLVSLVALPAVLLTVVVGVALNSTVGIVLAVAGLLLTVACLWAGAESASRGWARCAARMRSRLGPPPSRNHR